MVKKFKPGSYNYCDYHCDRCKELVWELKSRAMPNTIKVDLEDFAWYHTLLVAKTARLVSGFDELPGDFQQIVNLLDLLKKIEKQLKTVLSAKVNQLTRILAAYFRYTLSNEKKRD